MAKKISKPIEIVETQDSPLSPTLPPPLVVLAPSLGFVKVDKKAAVIIPPPDIGIDKPKFSPTIPIPSSIDIDPKTSTLWRSQPVGGLWTTDQNLNGWLWFAKENWVRLSEETESGLMAMMMLAASGKETGTSCLFRRENDNKIHEIYIF